MLFYYRPQTKFAKVIISQVSVCPLGVSAFGPRKGVCHTHPWADTPPRLPSACWIHIPPAQCMLGYGQQAGGTHPTSYNFTGVCPQGGGVCLWSQEGCLLHTPLGRYPPRQTPPHLPSACWDTHTPCPVHAGIHTNPSAQCMLGCGQQAGGTHPIGMHSCLKELSLRTEEHPNPQ